MAFKAEQKQVSEILQGTYFEVPRNQRRYVWEVRQWEDLFSDIENIANHDNKIPHFIGSVVLQETDNVDKIQGYTIIDGQQRITTIVIILAVLLKKMHELNEKDLFEGLLPLIQSKNINSKKKEVMSSEYHQSIQMLIKNIANMTFTDSHKELSIAGFLKENTMSDKKDDPIRKCFSYYYDKLSSYIENSEKINKLISFRDALINMNIVKIVSTTDEDSYTIFEILNARGQPLADHELVKNYIMRYIYPEPNRDDAKNTWHNIEITIGKNFKDFLKHYTDHMFRKTKVTNVSEYQTIRTSNKFTETQNLLIDLEKKSCYYNKFINPTLDTDDGNCTKEEFITFSFFKKNSQKQFRPILLSAMHQKDLENIDEKTYNSLLKKLHNFFICYTIIGEEKSNKLENLVFKYSYQIENEYRDESIPGLVKELNEKVPDFETFKRIFCSIGWSHHSPYHKDDKHKKKVQFILKLIEEHESKRKINDGDFTIEHMLNDSESIENAKIGNLIPLEEAINRNCKNLQFPEKLAYYDSSTFITARNINKIYGSGKKKNFDITTRSELLAKKVYSEILGFEIKK